MGHIAKFCTAPGQQINGVPVIQKNEAQTYVPGQSDLQPFQGIPQQSTQPLNAAAQPWTNGMQ